MGINTTSGIYLVVVPHYEFLQFFVSIMNLNSKLMLINNQLTLLNAKRVLINKITLSITQPSHTDFNVKYNPILTIIFFVLVSFFFSHQVCARDSTNFSYNHQIGYETAAQSTQDPLVSALLARNYSEDMARLFVEISEVNRRYNGGKLAQEDIVYNSISGLPVVGGPAAGALISITNEDRSETTGLAYGDVGNTSVAANRIDFFFHPDRGVRLYWTDETKQAYQNLLSTYTENQIKSAFKSAISDVNGQLDPENLEYLHNQLSLGEGGILGCDPTKECQRFEGYHRVSVSPAVKLPVDPNVFNELTGLSDQIKKLEQKLNDNNSISNSERAQLRLELHSLRGELKFILEEQKLTQKTLEKQTELLEKIAEQTRHVAPSADELERREIAEMQSNPVTIGGVSIFVPKDIRADLRLGNEALKTVDALIRISGGSEDAQKFIAAGNATLQVVGAVSTISKLSSGTITAGKGAMMLSSATSIIGAVSVAMELFGPGQSDPTNEAFQQIFKMLGAILENQKIMLEKLEGLQVGQQHILLQLATISDALRQLSAGQRDFSISVISNLEAASCERQTNQLDLIERTTEIFRTLQLEDLRRALQSVSPEILIELSATTGIDYTPTNEQYLELLVRLVTLGSIFEENGGRSNNQPPFFDYKNLLLMTPNAPEKDFVSNGNVAYRMQTCGGETQISQHDRRGMTYEILSGACVNSFNCSSLSTDVDGVYLQDLLVTYLKIVDALMQSEAGKEAVKNDIYNIQQLLKDEYKKLDEQAKTARELLPITIKQYAMQLNEVEAWITYALQLDIASVIGPSSSIGWSQRNANKTFGEYILASDEMLREQEIKKQLDSSFYARASIAEHLGLGKMYTGSEDKLKYYWHAHNWSEGNNPDWWMVAGFLSGEWFSFDKNRLRAHLVMEGGNVGALDSYLNKNRTLIPKGGDKNILLDGIFRYTQYRSHRRRNETSADYSDGHHHSWCFDLGSHLPLYRPGEVSSGRLPLSLGDNTFSVKWSRIKPDRIQRSTELYQKYINIVCSAPNTKMLYRHVYPAWERDNKFPKNSDEALSTIMKDINFSRSILLQAILPTSIRTLKVTRDDWETYMITGANSESLPSYKGWFATPLGIPRESLSSAIRNGDIVGSDFGVPFLTHTPKELAYHRKTIHKQARIALAKLTAARLAIITALELGYGPDCINSNVQLHSLHSSILQGALVSGVELRSINYSEPKGRQALDRLLFSKELINAFLSEFNQDELDCNKGYYAAKKHIEILEQFEATMSN